LDRYEDLKPSDIAPAIESHAVSLLRGRIGEVRTFCFTAEKWDPKILSMKELAFVVLLLTEELLMDPRVQVSGGSLLFDLSGFSFAHVMQCTVGELRILIETMMV
jgi:hypothetical protein